MRLALLEDKVLRVAEEREAEMLRKVEAEEEAMSRRGEEEEQMRQKQEAAARIAAREVGSVENEDDNPYVTLEERHAVVDLQRVWRGHMARRRKLGELKARIAKRRMEKEDKAATAIQKRQVCVHV